MKRIIPIFVLLVGALSIVLYLKLSEQQLQTTRSSRGSGTIEGTEVAAVTRLPSRILAIHAQEGDQVEAGQLLVELDCSEPQAALAQAEAALHAARGGVEVATLGIALAQHGVKAAGAQTTAAKAAARATRAQRLTVKVKRGAAKRAAKRVAKLAQAGGATDQDLDRAQSEVAALGRQLQTIGVGSRAASKQASAVAHGEGAATLRVDLAKARLDAVTRQVKVAEAVKARAEVAIRECRVTAPRGGLVTHRNFEPGEVVMPGSRVLTMVDMDVVRATFYLPNAELDVAEPGRKVVVVADAISDRKFEGTIRRVGAKAEFTPRNVQTRDDRDRLVYAIEVAIPNPDKALRPGMPVEIEIPNTERAAKE